MSLLAGELQPQGDAVARLKAKQARRITPENAARLNRKRAAADAVVVAAREKYGKHAQYEAGKQTASET